MVKIKFCKICEIEIVNKKNKLFCSKSCANYSRYLHNDKFSHHGTISSENSDGKIIQKSNFKNIKQLKELMKLFKSAPVLIVKFN